MGVDAKALGLSFLSNFIFSIHELEAPREDTFPNRGETTQAAGTVSFCVYVRSSWKGLVYPRLGVLVCPWSLSSLRPQTTGHLLVMWKDSQGICDPGSVEDESKYCSHFQLVGSKHVLH